MRKYELIAMALVLAFCFGVFLIPHFVPGWRTAHWIELLKSERSEDQRAAQKALAAIGKAAVPALLKHALSPEPEARAGVLAALGELRADAGDAVPMIIKALRDPDPRVRGAAAAALGSIGKAASSEPEPVVQALLRALHDDDKSVRVKAISAVGDLGPQAKEAFGQLKNLLTMADVSQRTEAVRTLARIDARAAVSLLIGALRDGDYHVRIAAIQALGFIGPEAREAAPVLLRAFQGARQGPKSEPEARATLGSTPQEQKAIDQALLRIDPEVVARFRKP